MKSTKLDTGTKGIGRKHNIFISIWALYFLLFSYPILSNLYILIINKIHNTIIGIVLKSWSKQGENREKTGRKVVYSLFSPKWPLFSPYILQSSPCHNYQSIQYQSDEWHGVNGENGVNRNAHNLKNLKNIKNRPF